MFNTIQVHNHSTEYIPYEKKVTVHEHRAPTDESIKIYDELKDKAEKSVIAAYTVKNNIVEGCVLEMEEVDYCQNIKLLVKIKINGEEFITRESFEKPEGLSMQLFSRPETKRKFIADKFKEVLTALIAKSVLQQIKIEDHSRILRG